MKREFEVGDVARLSGNVRGRGFMLKSRQEVKVVGFHKIEDKAGAYSYDIEVKHPKTGEVVRLERWVSQFQLIPKEMWAELVRLSADVGRPLAGEEGE